jgi:hypothetical protein
VGCDRVVVVGDGTVTGVEELAALREQVRDLPHAPACQRNQLCWCPLHDVLELIDDRLLMLESGSVGDDAQVGAGIHVSVPDLVGGPLDQAVTGVAVGAVVEDAGPDRRSGMHPQQREHPVVLVSLPIDDEQVAAVVGRYLRAQHDQGAFARGCWGPVVTPSRAGVLLATSATIVLIVLAVWWPDAAVLVALWVLAAYAAITAWSVARWLAYRAAVRRAQHRHPSRLRPEDPHDTDWNNL